MQCHHHADTKYTFSVYPVLHCLLQRQNRWGVAATSAKFLYTPYLPQGTQGAHRRCGARESVVISHVWQQQLFLHVHTQTQDNKGRHKQTNKQTTKGKQTPQHTPLACNCCWLPGQKPEQADTPSHSTGLKPLRATCLQPTCFTKNEPTQTQKPKPQAIASK